MEGKVKEINERMNESRAKVIEEAKEVRGVSEERKKMAWAHLEIRHTTATRFRFLVANTALTSR